MSDSTPPADAAPVSSTKPYLLRALYEWCVDNGFTPYVSVAVDADTRVPMEYVRDGEIVLNIGPLATSKMHMGNDWIECSARFSGVSRELLIPVGAVSAIYARENGHGMSFEPERAAPSGGEPAGEPAGEALRDVSAPAGVPSPAPAAVSSIDATAGGADAPEPPERPRPAGGRPALRRVK